MLYRVNEYSSTDDKFLNTGVRYSLEGLIEELKKDNYYHFRIHRNGNYILFGDIDGYIGTIDNLKGTICDFMKNRYNVKIEYSDIKYTKNNSKEGSYHYSVPKYWCSGRKLKEIHSNLKKIIKAVDRSIYSEHWFRCPNQSKGNKSRKDNNKHIIVEGVMKDFVVSHIEKGSINIEKKVFKKIEIIKNKGVMLVNI